ncbi:acyltransferase [Novosphingobium piscinae]|uniref:Acyltransferase n=1 Tax=Novosphingobium piscinae TaxID=1507448 RepID=A0A7X1G195_9SPHN|nr:acyltransferase [Novosphingobium piscinae]MBC2670761.1 acyltransferase [Novosphingobium piscinae]
MLLKTIFWFSAGLSLILVTALAGRIERVGFPVSNRKDRLPCIDGLRGYLAIAVMFHHFFIWTMMVRYDVPWGKPSSYAIESLGQVSVRLFFMITGMVFYPKILEGFSNLDWKSLYYGRFFRIVPLILLSFVMVSTIIFARGGAKTNSNYLIEAISWITGWKEVDVLGYPFSRRLNAGVLWSIWYEWLFYLFILPACAAMMQIIKKFRLPSITVPLLLFLIGAVASVLYRFYRIDVSVLRYAPLFAVGMMAYELRNHEPVRLVLSQPLMGLVALLALGASMLMPNEGFTLALPLSGFFFVCIACGNSLWGLLVSQGAAVLGEVSFGIYVVHGIVLAIVFEEGAPLFGNLATPYVPIVMLPVSVLLVLITCLTFLVIERPGIRLGRWLSRRA